MFIKIRQSKKEKETAININHIEYIESTQMGYLIKMSGDYVLRCPKDDKSTKIINNLLLTQSCQVIQ